MSHGKSRNAVEFSYSFIVHVNRWYRAPEVINNPEHYDSKLDVWSVGCIMAELIKLTPLFPGVDTKDQIARIVAILGTPTEDKLTKLCQECMFSLWFEHVEPFDRFQDMRTFILNEIPHSEGVKFKVLFPNLSEKGKSIQWLYALVWIDWV